jgi:hypothetical protein
MGSHVVLCEALRGHNQTHVYTTTADDGRSVTLEWEQRRCSSCGESVGSLGCVPDLSGQPAHTYGGGCEVTQ